MLVTVCPILDGRISNRDVILLLIILKSLEQRKKAKILLKTGNMKMIELQISVVAGKALPTTDRRTDLYRTQYSGLNRGCLVIRATISF